MPKPLEEFYVYNKKTGARKNQCKDCYKDLREDYRRNYDRKLDAFQVRWKQIKWKYGLDEQAWLLMYESQKGKCAICYQRPKSRNLCVDHCHTSGKIRGLLCANCNHGLGNFKDNPKILRRAANYLKKSKDE